MVPVLCILHITDFHIEDEFPVDYQTKLVHVVDAISANAKLSNLVIVVSGDIANTGSIEQYENANRVFSFLIDRIRSEAGISAKLVIVPGNHDVYNPLESVPSWRDERAFEQELDRMENFFCFSSCCLNIDWRNRNYYLFELQAPDYSGFSGIRFCCLNTAPFSTTSYDKGAHMLFGEAARALRKASSSELSIVVAHHCPDWWDDDSRLEFEVEATKSIDVLIAGHEHRGDTLIEDYSRGDLPIFRGSTFSFNDEKDCGFTLISFGELTQGEYQVEEVRYKWDSSSRIFISSPGISHRLMIKGIAPKPTKDYLAKLTSDINKEQDFFEKSFSFPRLRSSISILPEDKKIVSSQFVDINSANDFFDYLEKWDCVKIAGRCGSGKSCLARNIYLECIRRGYSPVLIHPNNSTHAFETTLGSLIEEQYGDSLPEAEAFKQTPKEKKIIIADDFDRIKRAKRRDPGLLVRQMLNYFSKVILLVPDGKDEISYALSDGGASAYVTYGSLEICACTKQKRDQLVTKMCQAAGLENDVTWRMIGAVDRAARCHAGLFELTPAFVAQYVEYYLSNQVELLSQEELPFRHIFDSNIKRDMSSAARVLHLGHNILQQLDAAISALQEVAFKMHINRRSVMGANDVSKVIVQYAEEHDIELIPRDVLAVAEESGILVKLEDGFSYMFSSLYIHSYFVAKRIDAALDLAEAGISTQIDNLLDEICFTVNENVVVFLAQLRLSTEFPVKLIQRATRFVGAASPSGLLDPQIHTSLLPLVDMKMSAVNEERAGAITQIEDQLEDSERSRLEDIEYADYYDYDKSQLEQPIVQAFMAVKYAELAAGYLVKQSAKLPKEIKRKIREALFQIPQSASNLILLDIDKRFNQLVANMLDSLPEKIEGVDDKESFVRKLVATIAFGFCYISMGSVFARASENQMAVNYLLKAEGESFEYEIEKLFAQFYGGDLKGFVSHAANLASRARKDRKWIVLIMIQMITNQFLRDSARLSNSEKHKLIDGVFKLPGDSSNAKLGLRNS